MSRAENTSAALSGVQVSEPPTASSKAAVRLRGAPPVAATTHAYRFVYHSSSRPSCDTNAIHFPSGDHAGLASGPLRATSATGAPPAASTTYRSERKLSGMSGVVWPEKAICLPSGESEKSLTWSAPLVSWRAARVATSISHRRLQG